MTYLVGNCGGVGLPFLLRARGGWGPRRRPPRLPLPRRARWIRTTLDGGAPDLVLARAVAALMEKVVAVRRRSGEEGMRAAGRRAGEGSRRAAVLARGGDAGRRASDCRGERQAVRRRSASARAAGDFF